MSRLAFFFSLLLFSSTLFASEILDKIFILALGSEEGFALPLEQTSKDQGSSLEKTSTKKQITGDQPNQAEKPKEKKNKDETGKQTSNKQVSTPSNGSENSRNSQTTEKVKDDFIRGY